MASVLEKRAFLANRDGSECWYCGEYGDADCLTLEHILSECEGGKAVYANLALACQECNLKVRGMTIVEKVNYRDNRRVLPNARLLFAQWKSVEST